MPTNVLIDEVVERKGVFRAFGTSSPISAWVGYWVISGLVMITLSFVDPDPGCVKTLRPEVIRIV